MIRKLILCIAIILMSTWLCMGRYHEYAAQRSLHPVLVKHQVRGSAYGTAQSSVILGAARPHTPIAQRVTPSPTANTSINSFADPGNFIVNTYVSSSNVTNPSSVSSVDGVGQWFILNGGTPGSSVSVTTDIYFQGHISAPSSQNNTIASFTNYLSFVSEHN